MNCKNTPCLAIAPYAKVAAHVRHQETMALANAVVAGPNSREIAAGDNAKATGTPVALVNAVLRNTEKQEGAAHMKKISLYQDLPITTTDGSLPPDSEYWDTLSRGPSDFSPSVPLDLKPPSPGYDVDELRSALIEALYEWESATQYKTDKERIEEIRERFGI